MELFQTYGTVTSGQVIIDKFSGRSRGFGFVEMANDDEAQAAIDALNGTPYGGRPLTVNEARPREERGPGGGGGRGGYGGGGGYGGSAGGGGYGGGGGGATAAMAPMATERAGYERTLTRPSGTLSRRESGVSDDRIGPVYRATLARPDRSFILLGVVSLPG